MIFEFKFPDVGEGVHEGKILQLKMNPGDKVETGDILAIVETDKVVAEIPSSKSGILKKYGASEGQIIEVGKTLAFIELEGEKTVEIKEEKEETAGVVGELESAGNFVLPPSGEGLSDNSSESVSLIPSKEKILATPLARKMAQDKNLDLKIIKGTGPCGRITRDDILKELEKSKLEKQEAPLQMTEGKTKKTVFSTMRNTIAKNMEISARIPTATLHELSFIDEIKKMRDEINLSRENDRLSFLPFFIKILAVTLKEFPQFNATFDSGRNEITEHFELNIGIALETPKGLMVPVLRNVQTLTILEIHQKIKELSEKGRSGAIDLSSLRGGTITVTNYGGFGGIYGNPLLNAPQVAIVGFGRIHETVKVQKGVMTPSLALPFSLVFDHRAIDGAPAGKFATAFRENLSSPSKLLTKML